MPDLPTSFALHLPTLMLMSVVVMGSAATIMTVFGISQRVYRGYWWWTGAMWLAAAGAMLHAIRSVWPEAVVPGIFLVLVWPMLIVTGVRRFFARDRLFSSPAIDATAFSLCYAAWLACWVGDMPQLVRSTAFSLSSLLLYLYAAVFLYRIEERRRSPALKLLVLLMIAMAAVPLLRVVALVGMAGAGDLPARPLLAAGVVLPLLIGVLFTVYLCLVLTHERTVRDLRETQRQLRVLADIDMLTQVPNRRHFEELATAIVGRSGAPSAVLVLFDIDHFKRINDTLGHAVGDEALRLVARCTRETLRTRDVMGRVGGDEFMLLLPGASVDDALLVAERITRRLDAQRSSLPLPLSLSFGVVRIEPGEALESAQHRADQALYEAKRQGRRRAVPAALRGPDTVFGESRSLGFEPQ